MVLAFSPDSRATLTKLTPSPLAATGAELFATPGSPRGGSCPFAVGAIPHADRPIASKPSSDNTTEDLLSDWRNLRREENKCDTFPHWAARAAQTAASLA
jgi:hypothetical protein